jgi:hypothetical protein
VIYVSSARVRANARDRHHKTLESLFCCAMTDGGGPTVLEDFPDLDREDIRAYPEYAGAVIAHDEIEGMCISAH